MVKLKVRFLEATNMYGTRAYARKDALGVILCYVFEHISLGLEYNVQAYVIHPTAMLFVS